MRFRRRGVLNLPAQGGTFGKAILQLVLLLSRRGVGCLVDQGVDVDLFRWRPLSGRVSRLGIFREVPITRRIGFLSQSHSAGQEQTEGSQQQRDQAAKRSGEQLSEDRTNQADRIIGTRRL